MGNSEVHSFRGWRHALAAVLVAVFAAACGGGGGDAPPDTPADTAITGNWALTITAEGETSTAVAVPASAVPTAAQVQQLTTANVAQTFATTSFQGLTVNVSGSTVTVTGPGTNYTLVINSFQASGYQGCGACTVGTQVSYTVNMSYTESGVLQNQAVPANNDSITVLFRFVRTA